MDTDVRILVPVRYAAWLAGDLGRAIHQQLAAALDPVPRCKVTRLPRGFLVEADEAAGPLLECVARAMQEVEEGVATAYPIFHDAMGPLWTRTLQAVFP